MPTAPLASPATTESQSSSRSAPCSRGRLSTLSGGGEMATLSTTAPHCEIASRTDPGRVRSANEDAVRFDANLGLAILADGMGGYAAGEVASRMAVDEIFDELASALPHLHAEPVSPDRAGLHEDMRFAAARANSSIIAAARREPDYEGMGSTLVIARSEEHR